MPGERGAAGIAGPKGDRVSDGCQRCPERCQVLAGLMAPLSWPCREMLERRDPRELLGRTAHAYVGWGTPGWGHGGMGTWWDGIRWDGDVVGWGCGGMETWWDGDMVEAGAQQNRNRAGWGQKGMGYGGIETQRDGVRQDGDMVGTETRWDGDMVGSGTQWEQVHGDMGTQRDGDTVGWRHGGMGM